MAVELGVGYISVVPSARGFQSRLQAAVRGSTVTIPVIANAANLNASLRAAHGNQTALGREMGDSAGIGLVDALTNAARKAILAVSTVFAAKQIFDFATTGINVAKDFEVTEVAFTGLRGSAELAQEQLAEFMQFARVTPFDFPELVDAAQKLLAFGFSAEEIIPTMEILGDTAAALGQSGPDINRVVRALGQIGSKGRVQLEELNQIAEAFPGTNPVEDLAKAMNVSSEDFAKALSEPGGALKNFGLTGDQAVRLLLESFKTVPGAMGAMERRSRTLDGALSNLKDTLRIIAIESFKPFLPELTNAILTKIIPALEKLGKRVPGVLAQVLASAKSAGRVLQSVFQSEEMEAAGRVLARIFRGLAKLFRIFVDNLEGLGPPARAVFGALIQFTDKFVTFTEKALKAVRQAYRDFRGELDGIGKPTEGIFAGLGHLAGQLFNFLSRGFSEFKSGLDGTVSESDGVLARLGRLFATFAENVKESFRDVQQFFSDLILGPNEADQAEMGALSLQEVENWAFRIREFLGGAMQKVREEWEKAEPIIIRVLDYINEHQTGIKIASDALVAFAGALGGLAVLKVADGAFGGVIRTAASIASVAITATGGPWGLLIAAIFAVGVAAVVAYEKVKPFHDFVDGIGQGLKDKFLAAREEIEKLGPAFDKLFPPESTVAPGLSGADDPENQRGRWERFKRWFSENVTDTVKAAGGAFDALGEESAQALDEASKSPGVLGFIAVVKDMTEGVLGFARGISGLAEGALRGDMKKVFEGLIDLGEGAQGFADAGDTIARGFEAIGNVVGLSFLEDVKIIDRFMTDFTDDVRKLATEHIPNLVKKLPDLALGFAGVVDKGMGKFLDGVRWLALDGIPSLVTKIPELGLALLGLGGKALEGLASVMDTVAGGIERLGRALIGPVDGGMTKFVEGLRAIDQWSALGMQWLILEGIPALVRKIPELGLAVLGLGASFAGLLDQGMSKVVDGIRWLALEGIPGLVTKIPELALAFVGLVDGGMSKFVEGIRWLALEGVPALANALPGLATGLATGFLSVLDGGMTKFVEGVQWLVLEGLPGMVTKLPEVGLAILGLIPQFVSLIDQGVGKFVDGIRWLTLTGIPNLVNRLPDVGLAIIGVITQLPTAINAIADTIFNPITNAFYRAFNAIIRAWNGLEFKLPDFPGWVATGGVLKGKTIIPGFTGPSISTKDIDEIPLIESARGNVFNADTIRLLRLAETPSARPEIISPQKLMAETFRKELAAVGGGGGVRIENVNVENPVDATADEVVAAIGAKLGWRLTTRNER